MKHWLDFKDPEGGFNIVKNNKDKKKSYCNDIFVLDTETSSFFKIDGKWCSFDKSKSPDYYREHCEAHYGLVYIWMLSVNEVVYYGRDLRELSCFLGLLSRHIGVKFFIYIHNMAYDFQFLRNVIKFKDIFAREKGKPLMAVCKTYNVEFRDSLILTQMSLAALGKTYKLENRKKCGSLDYTTARLPETPLTEEEMGYCEADCLVLYEYIKKYEIPQWKGKIKNIPMTQTSKVRRELKKYITEYHSGKPQYALKDWKKRISKMHPDPDTYLMLVDCYAGGYTHANVTYAGEIVRDVKSCDFTSSYPSVMISRMYPMTNWYTTTTDVKKWNFKKYAYMATFTFYNVNPYNSNHFVSVSKIHNGIGVNSDNGRLTKATRITISMIDPDFRTFCKSYRFDSMKVENAKRSKLGYLPAPIAFLIVDYFEKKLKLKPEVKRNPDDVALNALYQQIKQYINSIYGMSVTKYINGLCGWDGENDEWIVDNLDKPDENGEVFTKEKYDEVKERIQRLDGTEMMCYAWGVYVAAYARENLWDGILAIGCDVVYCDTDSIKYVGNHEDYFIQYNEKIHEMMKKAAEHYGFDVGRIGDLGEWDMNDGEYSRFITLGAKKYCYVDKKTQELHITISGVNKKKGVAALRNINDFRIGLEFGYETSGRVISYFINDGPDEITLTDFMGHEETIHGMRYGICMQPTTYTMGITQDYLNCIMQCQSDPAILRYIAIDSYSRK